MQPRTPIFIVTSSRPRVGKTLIARALVEYFRAQSRLVHGFDVNPDEFKLLDTLPGFAAAANVRDTRGEMALFDQLVLGDNVAKVVDLGHTEFDRFFAVAQQINFAVEARRRGVIPIVLFVADPDDRSRQGYAMLKDRFADLAPVPVLNEAVPRIAHFRDNFPPTRRGGEPLAIPALTPVVRSVVDRPKFSFIAYVVKTTDTTTELYGWITKVFLAFRELEVRILLEELNPGREPPAQLPPGAGVAKDRVSAPRMRSMFAPGR